MTDNRMTELREKLNKLIIDIERLDIMLDSPAYDMTLGEYEQKLEKLLDEFMQVIAATLESETCELIDTTDTGNNDYWNSARCSKCGAEFTCGIFGRDTRLPDADYCPNCGAKVVNNDD